MSEDDRLAEQFEAQRPHLQALAYRMLGSREAARDAAQEAWLRLSRSDAASIDNLGGWLTTVVSRLCLDALRARKVRGDEARRAPDPVPVAGDAPPDAALLWADSLGAALGVVLDALGPAERVAFVLHDLFDWPFAEIAAIVGRSPAAARQLASRARRRLQGAEAGATVDPARQRDLVRAFLAASRDGDLAALLALLDPEVVLRADPAAVAQGAPRQLSGADAVAALFQQRTRALRPALIEGLAGAVWAPGGARRGIIEFQLRGGRIVALSLRADPALLGELAVSQLAE